VYGIIGIRTKDRYGDIRANIQEHDQLYAKPLSRPLDDETRWLVIQMASRVVEVFDRVWSSLSHTDERPRCPHRVARPFRVTVRKKSGPGLPRAPGPFSSLPGSTHRSPRAPCLPPLGGLAGL
jgi:hypothetical protein